VIRARPIAVSALFAAWLAGCDRSPEPRRSPAGEPATEPTAVATDWAQAARQRMVKEQIAARGVDDPRVLAALAKVPRHEFIPEEGRDHAYEDHPVPIGHGQTISQPYIVAIMTQLARLDARSKVLEIGTGSGYQAAVLGEVAGEVYTIEILPPLAKRAEETLARLAYANVHVRAGDGYQGWPENAPFDAVVVTAAPPEIPAPLREQLAVGGRMVIPVGDRYQELRVITRTETGFEERTEFPVRFVPMTGEAQGD
jgi:protein-L-isoaspartate(D-aspartate) O-methyltransferase